MCKMSSKWKWGGSDWLTVLMWLLIFLATLTFILSGGCTIRVQGFQRPEPELRTIIREECIRGIHAYQEYLERERETDGTCPLKPVS